MKLRIITLIAAITQLLTALLGLRSFILLVQEMQRRGASWDTYAEQAMYRVAQIVLVIFLFALFARLKRLGDE